MNQKTFFKLLLTSYNMFAKVMHFKREKFVKMIPGNKEGPSENYWLLQLQVVIKLDQHILYTFRILRIKIVTYSSFIRKLLPIKGSIHTWRVSLTNIHVQFTYTDLLIQQYHPKGNVSYFEKKMELI